MRLLGLGVLLLAFILGCSQKNVISIQKIEDIQILERNEVLDIERCNCNDHNHYVPDPAYPIFEDEMVIKVNLHFMNSTDRSNNHTGKAAVEYAKNVIYDSNLKFRENAKMRLPIGNDTPVYDTRIVLKIEKDESTPSGLAVYEHFDDELYFLVNKGKNQNNYSREVIKKYAINEDHVLNIFAMPHHRDSLASKNYRGGQTGIALGNSIKIAGVNEHPPREAWRSTTLVTHEIGHVFGLRHAWTKNDLCEDTPPNPNCWDENGPPLCDSLLSNNMMDYNNSQKAITPCQIGVMRSKMYAVNRKTRNLVRVDYCDYMPEKSLVVKDSFHMNRIFNMKGDIIVEEDAYLRLSCHLHMPKGSQIIVYPGGTLDINGAHIYNDCGELWGGIQLIDQEKKKARLINRGDFKILDVDTTTRSETKS